MATTTTDEVLGYDEATRAAKREAGAFGDPGPAEVESHE